MHPIKNVKEFIYTITFLKKLKYLYGEITTQNKVFLAESHVGNKVSLAAIQ